MSLILRSVCHVRVTQDGQGSARETPPLWEGSLLLQLNAADRSHLISSLRERRSPTIGENGIDMSVPSAP